ncbi:MAG: hypothetical protein AAF363_18915 [Bacteroidota bacterium]
MKFLKYTLLLFLGTSFMFSCDEEDDLIDQRLALVPDQPDPVTPPNPMSGNADFTNYVAIGNSLTAGFADAALFPLGQLNSFPVILSEQFSAAGGGSFVFPDIVSGDGFGSIDEEGNPVGRSFIDLAVALQAIAGVEGVAVEDAIQNLPGSPLTLSSNTGMDLNNFGVPGARIVDAVTPGYGAFNPFYGAFQSSPMASMIGDAASANGTFFTAWLGSNDILGYAINGGASGEAFNPMDPGTSTDVPTFVSALTDVLNDLSANGASGVILNIPPITIIPFFQTVTQLSGGIDLIPLDQVTADAVNAGFAEYNQGLGAALQLELIDQAELERRTINFSAGNNPPVITDENSITQNLDISAAFMAPAGTVILPNLRQASIDPTTGLSDLFPLTALGTIGSEAIPGDLTSTIGVGVPVPDSLTLTIAEQVFCITQYATYNGIIAQQVAARPNLFLVDVGPLFADVFGLSAAAAAGLGLSPEAQAAADGVLGTEVSGVNLVPLSLSQEELYNSIWSTDGIHANPRGNALIANEIIAVINEAFEASIQTVNPLDFPGVNAPFGAP